MNKKELRTPRTINPVLNRPSVLVADDKLNGGEETPQNIKDIPIPKSLKERMKGKVFVVSSLFGDDDNDRN